MISDQMLKDLTTRTNKLNTCVECGKVNNSATATCYGSKPEKDCLSICWYCGHVAIFNQDLTLREPTTDECLEIHQSAEVRYILALRKRTLDATQAEAHRRRREQELAARRARRAERGRL